jgi:hypothetical protein
VLCLVVLFLLLCCGCARYIWVDFNEYDGEWRSGRLHGQGTFVWKTGERYDGEWKVGTTVLVALGNSLVGAAVWALCAVAERHMQCWGHDLSRRHRVWYHKSASCSGFRAVALQSCKYVVRILVKLYVEQ